MDDVGACPDPLWNEPPVLSCESGGYVWGWSTVRVSERPVSVLLFDANPAFKEAIEGFRGGNGGDLIPFAHGGDSR